MTSIIKEQKEEQRCDARMTLIQLYGVLQNSHSKGKEKPIDLIEEL